jgi:hypothetical protein
MAERMAADDVRRAVYAHFSDRYAVVFEVASAGDDRWRGSNQRRIDALLVRRAPLKKPSTAQLVADMEARRAARVAVPEPDGLFPAPEPAAAPAGSTPDGDDGGVDRLALEIKVSRGDFLQDIRCPEKQAPWRELAHRHAYVVPEGLVQAGEIPADSGLIVVRNRDGWRTCDWVRKAPRAETARPLPTAIILDAFYRWARAEASAKGYTGNARDDDPEAMRLELKRLRHQVELLEGKVDRAQDATAAWKRRYAAVDPPPCSTCGQPLRPARRGINDADGYLRWEHPAAVEEGCKTERHRRALAAHLLKPEDQRWGSFVPGPEPAYPGDAETSEAA